MATNGAVAIQGCAFRISRLGQTGAVVASTTGMVQDDRPLVKLTLKPEILAGVDITPISACGVPVISYKDCDRYKRWNVTLSLGDWDPEALELIAQGTVITSTGSAGRTGHASFTVFENTLNSTALTFVTSDIGRTVVDAGFVVASCTTTNLSKTVTTTNSFTTSGVVAGMPVSGTGIAATTVVTRVTSATQLTLSKAATAGGTVSLTFHSLPLGAYITSITSSTKARLNAPALKTVATVTVTLGAQPVGTIGYAFPQLLQIACPFGVSIEVWEKAIVRGTGYQGSTPYPSAGTPVVPGSAFIRTGIFRAFLWHGDFSVENKEAEKMFNGWAIENPNFGTGPVDDWRTTGLPGTGSPVTTQRVILQMADFELPSPRQPGYQTTPF